MCFWFTDLFTSMDLAIKISSIDICFPNIIIQTALYLKNMYTACLTSLISSINCQHWIIMGSIKQKDAIMSFLLWGHTAQIYRTLSSRSCQGMIEDIQLELVFFVILQLQRTFQVILREHNIEHIGWNKR